jgi:hypothetical protein
MDACYQGNKINENEGARPRPGKKKKKKKKNKRHILRNEQFQCRTVQILIHLTLSQDKREIK